MNHLQTLVDAGNIVVMVELDMQIVAGADYVIDMGPGDGDNGGQVVVTGAPAVVAEADSSASAPYLAAAHQPARGEQLRLSHNTGR